MTGLHYKYEAQIVLVEPGFNSGWKELMGIDSLQEDFDPVNDLVDFGGKGKYSDPEFTWIHTVGPTALKFLNSDNKLGKQYNNDMFVGDVHNGNIYHFKLNEARRELALGEGLLADKVADSDSELEESAASNSGIIFGKGFGGITDLEVGPDGYLYVVSIGQGAIYSIVQTSDGPSTITTTEDIETAGAAAEDGDSSDDDGED